MAWRTCRTGGTVHGEWSLEERITRRSLAGRVRVVQHEIVDELTAFRRRTGVLEVGWMDSVRWRSVVK